VKILNCESAASIYESIESAFDVEASLLNASFSTIAGNYSHYDSASDDDLLSSLGDRVITRKPFDATYWFHLTRTKRSNHFEEGILPLGEVVDSVWEMLFELLNNSFPREEWLKFREGVEVGYSNDDIRIHDYRLKVRDPFYWGPFAYLIKEDAIREYRSSRSQTHYLDMPEVIENICVSFKRMYEVDLPTVFMANTTPCIVKFVDFNSRVQDLLAALRYLFLVWHGSEDFPLNGVYKGLITADRIQAIQFLEI
jgi:hypothetical protein